MERLHAAGFHMAITITPTAASADRAHKHASGWMRVLGYTLMWLVGAPLLLWAIAALYVGFEDGK
jgi:hypothetical protein